MSKSKTYFPQVPVEVAKKVAEAESRGYAAAPLKRPKKKSSNVNGLTELKQDED